MVTRQGVHPPESASAQRSYLPIYDAVHAGMQERARQF